MKELRVAMTTRDCRQLHRFAMACHAVVPGLVERSLRSCDAPNVA